MAIAASNPFSVVIRVPAASSTPTVQDERDTYTLWGWTWNEATANPAYNSAASSEKIGTVCDVHGDTEGDDVWSNLQAYNRRTSGNNGYFERAQAWRNYYVNNFEGSADYNNDASGFGYDHFYGWGLVEYATQFSDSAALAEVVRISDALHAHWSHREGGTSWPTPGTFPMSYYALRWSARPLHVAVAVADATGNANAIELRDHLIDAWVASPDWDANAGMYWIAETEFQSGGFESAPYNMDYTVGDRAQCSWHIGILADAFYVAWLSPNVTQARKAALRAKLIAMATWARRDGLDPTYRYSGSMLGIYGSSGLGWHKDGPDFHNPVTSWNGVWTTALVNLLVMGYKFTGDSTFLFGVASNGHYPAQYVFNRGTKNIYGSPFDRECADNVCAHFQDTKFETAGGVPQPSFTYNKGEFQYTYLIFENGGAPTVL
jgi:hypothetical protein